MTEETPTEAQVAALRTDMERHFHHLAARIDRMSETLSQQLDDANASLGTIEATLTAGVNAVVAEIANLEGQLAGVNAGTTLTQAQIDTLNGHVSNLKNLATALTAAAAPPPPPAPEPPPPAA